MGIGLSKKDKRRQQIGSRLSKLNSTFSHERDNFYRGSLHHLQTTLATLQQGTNEEFTEKRNRLDESRDYELTKLRLWEEYQVKRIDQEYKEDINRAKENHDRMIKLIKEKLYDKLQKQIKQLKEDKLLLNLVNANSWNSVNANDSSTAALNAVAAANSLNINDRRSLRRRELSSRFTAGEADDLSDGGAGHSSAALHGAASAGSSHNNNLNAARGASGYILASNNKRRRYYATRYSSNDELSTGGVTGAGSGSGNGSIRHGHQNGASSGNDSNLSDKDYDALNSIIMGTEDGGMSLILMDHNGINGSSSKASSSGRQNTRGSHKQFVGVQGLKPEELNDDLNLLRNAIQKKEK